MARMYTATYILTYMQIIQSLIMLTAHTKYCWNCTVCSKHDVVHLLVAKCTKLCVFLLHNCCRMFALQDDKNQDENTSTGQKHPQLMAFKHDESKFTFTCMYVKGKCDDWLSVTRNTFTEWGGGEMGTYPTTPSNSPKHFGFALHSDRPNQVVYWLSLSPIRWGWTWGGIPLQAFLRVDCYRYC